MLLFSLLSVSLAAPFPRPRKVEPEIHELEDNRFAFYLDQDFFQLISPKSDQNYTMGFGAVVGGEFARRNSIPLAAVNWLLLPDKWLEDHTASHSIALLGSGYTPYDLRDDDPIHNDRPYASLLLVEWRQVAWDQLAWDDLPWGMRSAFVTELSLGALGLGVSPWAQTEIHELMQVSRGCEVYVEGDDCTPARPDGWEHQISAGGEPTARYGLSRLYRILDVPFGPDRPSLLDLTVQTKAEVGYYTAASQGATLRFGRISSPFWASAASTPLGGIQEAGDGTRPEQPFFEGYVFGTISGKAMMYNALLQGQFRPSVVTYTGAEMHRLLWRHDLGAVLRLGPVNVVYIANSQRSPELKGSGYAHSWGTVGVNMEWENYCRKRCASGGGGT